LLGLRNPQSLLAARSRRAACNLHGTNERERRARSLCASLALAPCCRSHDVAARAFLRSILCSWCRFCDSSRRFVGDLDLVSKIECGRERSIHPIARGLEEFLHASRDEVSGVVVGDAIDFPDRQAGTGAGRLVSSWASFGSSSSRRGT